MKTCAGQQLTNFQIFIYFFFQVKEDESPTLDAVKSIQETTVMLHKAKEIYKQRCAEMEKLKRDNASSKDLEKAESKFRKAQAQ